MSYIGALAGGFVPGDVAYYFFNYRLQTSLGPGYTYIPVKIKKVNTGEIQKPQSSAVDFVIGAVVSNTYDVEVTGGPIIPLLEAEGKVSIPAKGTVLERVPESNLRRELPQMMPRDLVKSDQKQKDNKKAIILAALGVIAGGFILRRVLWK